jgi:SAM-dependent methyltransferase
MNPKLAAWLAAADGSDEEAVERLWRLVLRREVDPEARDRAVAKLAAGTLSRATLLRELVEAEEFERVALLDDAMASALRAGRDGERPRELNAPARTDERPIEIPWCLARYSGERSVLDVGYAHAEAAYLAGLVALGATELVGVDLAEAVVPGLEGVVADVRDLPFDDDRFEVAFCISTLEHIGLDNTLYGVDAARDEDGQERALRELRRVLRPDGRLLVTVPAGEHQDLEWQVQRTPAGWVELFERSGFVIYEDELYELREDGWHSTTSLADARYGERGPGASGVLCAELRPDRVRERIGLAVRDRRHRDEPRRSTLGHSTATPE